MNYIVDTSVWSLALRRKSHSSDPKVIKLAAMLTNGSPIALLGVILQEILSGINSKPSFEQVKNYLEPFPILSLEREDYIAAAQLSNLCRSKGVQASTIDFQIAAVCIRNNCALLTCDNDFVHIAEYSLLQLI